MWLQKHNPEINWEIGEVEMMRCPRECNIYGRRQKQIKKRKQEVKGKCNTGLHSITVEEIDVEMPNADELIMIEKDD